MTSIVVPFRAGGKSRLPEAIRAELALAMLEDVLAATTSVAATVVVTDDRAAAGLADRLGATVVDDPGDGQGAAVEAALADAVGACVVVNADLPAAAPTDVALLLDAARAGAIVVIEAPDGTTNALALPSPRAFARLYGPGSAERFRAHAVSEGLVLATVDAPTLRIDVDTLADLDRVAADAGATTRRLLSLVG